MIGGDLKIKSESWAFPGFHPQLYRHTSELQHLPKNGSLDELVVETRNNNQAMNLLVDNTGKSTALYFNYGFFSIG